METASIKAPGCERTTEIADDDLVALMAVGIDLGSPSLHEGVFRSKTSEGDWVVSVKLNEVPYSVKHPCSYPEVRLVNDDGLHKAVVSLRWGRKLSRVHIQSQPAISFWAALEEACTMANSVEEELSIPPVRWREQMLEQTGSDRYGAFRFVNDVAVGLPQYRCILPAHPGMSEVASVPCRTMREAFTDLSKKIKEIRATDLAKKSPRPAAATPGARKAAPKKPTKPLLSQAERDSAEALLEEGRRRWRVEHRYLMSLAIRSKSEEQRVNMLSLFFAAMDPLRKYEMVPGQVADLGRAMLNDLSKIAPQIGPGARRAARIQHLRLLTGKYFVETGTEVEMSVPFQRALLEQGLEPQAVVDDLVSERLLRRGIGGCLTVSPIGVNLLEAAMEESQRPATVGASVSPEMLAALSNLKAMLAGVGK